MPIACHSLWTRRLQFESLEDRRLLAVFPAGGITVITHGAQLSSGLPDWTVSMGQAILDRADGASTSRSIGSIFQHDGPTGLWKPVGDSVWKNSNDPNQHIVLLYDWSSESGKLDDGWLDAAADNLFASLFLPNANLGGGLNSKTFVDVALDAGGGGGLLDLHLIGHSRGGVLNSLVAERFDKYFGELTIDQVTTLDPHPAGPMNDPGYVANSPSANSRAFTYDNVRFADNYYQSDGSYEDYLSLNFDFDGVAANGAYNFQIPSAVLNNGGSGINHSDAHTWYYGTITEPFAAGYAGFNQSGRNDDGDESFPEVWWGGGVPARNAIGFAYSRIADARPGNLPFTGAKISAGVVPTVVDGDLSTAVDRFLLADVLPGWQEHGGGGSGPLGGGDLYFELNSGGNDYFRRHNLMYFPRHTTGIEFDYWITDSDATDDRLQILASGMVIDSLSLASTSASFVRDRRVAFSLPATGLVGPVEFRIVDVAGDGVESAVRIDNVELVIQIPTASADFNASGRVEGGDFLAWQRGFGTFVYAKAAAGDADFDGNVLADDLALWRSAFGAPGVKIAAESLVVGPPILEVPLLNGSWLPPEELPIEAAKDCLPLPSLPAPMPPSRTPLSRVARDARRRGASPPSPPDTLDKLFARLGAADDALAWIGC